MMSDRPLRIAMLTHSANPRGGVVHALAVADALADMGHAVVVHAPDAQGQGFFRPTRCATRTIVTTPCGTDLKSLVQARIGDYIRHFRASEHRRFDVFHAHDGISGNALAHLVEEGLIPGFVRTVHHLDPFADAELAAWQQRSVVTAQRCLVVSRLGLHEVARQCGCLAVVVGNGVDRAVFVPQPDARDAHLCDRLALGDGPRFLAIGGIESRKNTLAILRAFAVVRTRHPDAQLIIAGGVSLLDHRAYRREFDETRAQLGLGDEALVLAGRMDQADMPALYRCSTALVFPSLQEGFGLVALEAIACGIPAIVSRMPPFTEHFSADDVLWCDPVDPTSIADAMCASLVPQTRAWLARGRESLLSTHDWRATASAHLPAYYLLAASPLSEVSHA